MGGRRCNERWSGWGRTRRQCPFRDSPLGCDSSEGGAGVGGSDGMKRRESATTRGLAPGHSEDEVGSLSQVWTGPWHRDVIKIAAERRRSFVHSSYLHPYTSSMLPRCMKYIKLQSRGERKWGDHRLQCLVRHISSSVSRGGKPMQSCARQCDVLHTFPFPVQSPAHLLHI